MAQLDKADYQTIQRKVIHIVVDVQWAAVIKKHLWLELNICLVIFGPGATWLDIFGQ